MPEQTRFFNDLGVTPGTKGDGLTTPASFQVPPQ